MSSDESNAPQEGGSADAGGESAPKRPRRVARRPKRTKKPPADRPAPDDRASSEEGAGERRPRRRRRRRPTTSDESGAELPRADAPAEDSGDGERPRRRRRRRGGRGRSGRGDSEERGDDAGSSDASEGRDAEGGAAEGGDEEGRTKPRRRRKRKTPKGRRKARGADDESGGEDRADGDEGERSGRSRRGGRKKKQQKKSRSGRERSSGGRREGRGRDGRGRDGRGRRDRRSRDGRGHDSWAIDIVPKPDALGGASAEKIMLVNALDRDEARIALLIDGKLEEIYVEPGKDRSMAGNVYRGRIQNVEQGIGAAFVDLGRGLTGFLHASDVPLSEGETSSTPVTERLHPGDEVLVQITRDGIGRKGPALTGRISLPGRYLVLMPFSARSGISRRIPQGKERERMRGLVRKLEVPEGMGVIVRTASESTDLAALDADLRHLLSEWERIRLRAAEQEPPGVLRAESDIAERSVRDIMPSDVTRIVVDREQTAGRIHQLLRTWYPSAAAAAEVAGSLAVRQAAAVSETPRGELVARDERNLRDGGDDDEVVAGGEDLLDEEIHSDEDVPELDAAPGFEGEIDEVIGLDEEDEEPHDDVDDDVDDIGGGADDLDDDDDDSDDDSDEDEDAEEDEDDDDDEDDEDDDASEEDDDDDESEDDESEDDDDDESEDDGSEDDGSEDDDDEDDEEESEAQLSLEDEAAELARQSKLAQVIPDVLLHTDDMPLFHAYDVEGQIEDAFRRSVRLPSGGSIVVDPTEALIAIDVNSGRLTDEVDPETTALRTNLEAVDEATRQLRLRDLGGLVVLDLIDMRERKSRRQVEAALREALSRDRARIRLGRMGPFGCVILSRQRIRQALTRITHEECGTCGGTGRHRHATGLGLRILREMHARAARSRGRGGLEVRAPQNVIDWIKRNRSAELRHLRKLCSGPVTLKTDGRLASDGWAMKGLPPSDGGGAPEHD